MANVEEFDVVVVGGGFGGVHQVFRALQAGLSVVALEKWEEFGGTWHKPNYPGAHCDIQCIDYSYSFDKDLEKVYQWKNRYASGDELADYICHVVKKHNLREHFRFNQEVISAKFNESDSKWDVQTKKGDSFRSQFLVFAVGCLTIPNIPSFARDFVSGGEKKEEEKKEEEKKEEEKMPLVFHSSRFPPGLVLDGKRVVVVGTGSTAQQASPEIAKVAKKVTVLQRTPNYSVPNGMGKFQAPEDWKLHREVGLTKGFGMDIGENLRKASDMTKEECIAEMEKRWEAGGFAFTGCFADLFSDPTTNMMVVDFLNSKTRQLVKDKKTAELLCPSYHYGCKRPSLSMKFDWWEHFNRDNVELVSVKEDPIETIVSDGVQLQSGRVIEADIVVLCSGYDAMTGAFFKINPIGRDGLELKQAWEAGSHSYLGLSTVGFPNLFWIAGPQSPSVLSSMVQCCEVGSDWILKAIQHTRKEKKKFIEPRPEAQVGWSGMTGLIAGATLIGRPECGSWYLGLNVPGKDSSFNIFLGWDNWMKKITAEAEGGFPSFVLGDEKKDMVKATSFPFPLDPSCENFLPGLGELSKGQPPPPLTPEGQRAMYVGLAATFGAGSNVGAPADYQLNENVPIRVFTPPGKKGEGKLPCIVYYHGGGFVIGDHINTHAGYVRDLCQDTGSVVVIPGYRLAPEHPFPAAHDDCFDVYVWVVENADKLNVDPTRIIVAGDSAGGNLSIGTTLAIKKVRSEGKDLPMPAGVGMFSPWLNLKGDSDSCAKLYAEGAFITKATLDWFASLYLFGENAPSDEDKKKFEDVKASPFYLKKEELEGFPKTFLRFAEVDPCRDDGLLFGQKLKEAGVDVDSQQADGVFHIFMSYHRRWTPAGESHKQFQKFVSSVTA